MSYVKNYDVGQIRLDLPTPNYFHELPLISFGDVHGNINLSLIFNYGMKVENKNPYHITDGYKLNMQKQLIISDNVPVKLENENGTIVDLNKITDDIYTFDDDTGRILRKADTTYELENPDFSRERYTLSGRIIDVLDKYGVTIYSYSYNLYNKLTSISYRGNSISFSYDNQDRLIKVKYKTKTINFSYTTSEVQVEHYNGVAFNLTFANHNFTARASATENSETVTYSTKIERPGNYIDRLKVSNLIGNDIVDEMTYIFSEAIIEDFEDTVLSYSYKYDQVELTDKTGVQTRIQFEGKRPVYSYEANSNGEYAEGNINIFNAAEDLNRASIACSLKKDTGYPMYVANETPQRWEFNASDYYNSDEDGYYIVTGWIRSREAFNSSPICISKGGGDFDYIFEPTATPYLQWKFFSYAFYCRANVIKVFPESTGMVELKDLRIIFKPTHIIDNSNGKRRVAISENVLIYHNGNSYDYLPLDEATFTCGNENISDYGRMYFEDILRYKLKEKKSKHPNEVYCNKCKNILYTDSSNELMATYNGTAYSLSNLYLGSRKYTPQGTVTTVYKDDTDNFFVIEVKDDNGTIISSQVFNNTLDVIEETVDGVTTSYTRQNDLMLSENVSGLYTKNLSYGTDENARPTITVTYEFDNESDSQTYVYTLDPVWGTVISSTLPDGQIITDEYDNNAHAKVKRTFTSGGRSNLYEYFGGNLSRVQCNDLFYDFTYDKGELFGVSKNGTQIEEHEISDTQTDIYYPSELNEVYSSKTTFDKYGRIVSVGNVLTNSYDLSPTCVFDEYRVSGVDNANGKLATSEDYTTGNKTFYAYDEDRLSQIGVFNSTNTKISEETLEYDNLGRLKDNVVKYDLVSSKEVSSNTVYVTTETDPLADNRVYSYTYNVNEVRKAYTYNTYDAFKRIISKNTVIGTQNTSFTKAFSYDNTRIHIVSDTLSSTNKGTDLYTYDSIGRITSDTYSSENINDYKKYKYDVLGQLEREDNQRLDKTLIYCYDNIGNISNVKTYSYTTSATPSTLLYEQEYSYDDTYTDRLTAFDGKAITYDRLGRPITYDGWTYTWTKDKLTSISKGPRNSTVLENKSYLFVYDAYGRRIKKEYKYSPGRFQQLIDYLESNITTYDYDQSGRLISETSTQKFGDGVTIVRNLVYLYDESGIIGVMYSYNGGTAIPYYYRRNLQGDVVAIYDANGNRKAEYLYDAYGNCNVYYRSGDTDIASANPIRYRGYYHDSDAGLYYLNARYYNPQWRRFISPDSTDYLDTESVNGLNLYAYCYNDPVNYCDPSGCSVSLILGLIGLGIGVGAGLGYAAYTDYQDDNDINGSVGWRTYLGYSMLGGALGYGLGYFWPSIASFLGGSFSFTLPSLGTLNMGGALALVGGTTVTVTGAQIAGGAIGIGVYLFSLGADRFKPKNAGSNTSQNEFVDHLQNKYGFSNKVRRRLHDKITKRGYSNKKVEEILRKMLGLDV